MARRTVERYEYAGLLERGIAWLVDGLVLFAVVLAVLIPLVVLSGGPRTAQGVEGVAALFGLLLSAAYYAGSEAKWGQTLGKMLLGIRVVGTDGSDCTGGKAALRNVTKVLGGSAFFPVIVAIVLVLATDESQRLGDIIGETIVIKA